MKLQGVEKFAGWLVLFLVLGYAVFIDTRPRDVKQQAEAHHKDKMERLEKLKEQLDRIEEKVGIDPLGR